MDLALYLLLFLALCQIYLLPDLKRRFATHRRHNFERDLYNFQLQQVRSYYPELKSLNYSEIDELYRVREAYYRIK